MAQVLIILAEFNATLSRQKSEKVAPVADSSSRHFDEFEEMYQEVYEPQLLAPFAPSFPTSFGKFMDCGNLERGFARIRCDHCQEEHLLAFSCKSRWFCPSCHQKNVQTSAQFIAEHVLAPVPHRHYVLAIPKMLRSYFQHHRYLLKDLCRLAQESLVEYQQTALEMPDGIPAIIMTVAHLWRVSGLPPAYPRPGRRRPFPAQPRLPQAQDAHAANTTATTRLQPVFCNPCRKSPLKPLEELFRAKIINHLVKSKLLPPERVQVLYSWKHSGFNVHHGQSVPPEAKADLEGLAQYILRNPFSVEKMTIESDGHDHLPLAPQRQNQPQL
jgi:hypothetical protein